MWAEVVIRVSSLVVWTQSLPHCLELCLEKCSFLLLKKFSRVYVSDKLGKTDPRKDETGSQYGVDSAVHVSNPLFEIV